MYGFKVNYEGPRCSYDSINLILAREHEQQLEENIYEEIREGRIADLTLICVLPNWPIFPP
jgi:hypothetical protein